MKREARDFIDKHGLEKAKRIVKNIVCNAEFYSDETGSYYSANKNNSVSLKHLKKAIVDYEKLVSMKNKYEIKLAEWRMK